MTTKEERDTLRLLLPMLRLSDYPGAINDIVSRLLDELDEQDASFEIRWSADMRAILEWQAAKPGNDMVWPDHKDLCVWLMEQLSAAKEQVERLTKGLLAVDELIRESRGVDGLHRNGDLATWEELLEGGRFDDWLKDFSAAVAALAPPKPATEHPGSEPRIGH